MTNERMFDTVFDFFSKHITFSDEEKRAIADLDIFSAVKKGTVLLKEGQGSNKSYFVLKGCLRIFYIIDGEEKTTSFYTEMEGISPHCVINQQPSEYYISCVEDSIIAVTSTDMETAMFEKFPRLESLCRIFTEQLVAKGQASLDEYKTSTPEQRYLNLLKTKPDLIQRVPQHQLASFLGITPQSLSRLRTRIVKKK